MRAQELVIRNWRITRGVPRGAHVWFDPECEVVKLLSIPPLDGVVPIDADPVGVDKAQGSSYLDMVSSVSACEDEGETFVQKNKQIDWVEDLDELPF